MLPAGDAALVFVCDCPSCGRRELRGPRSLHPVPAPGGSVHWVSWCRACGARVTVVEGRGRQPGAETAVPSAA